MKIEADPEFRAELMKRIEQREFHKRTGIHQSDLVYCLNKQALRRLFPPVNTDADLLLFSLGWSTQRWLTGQDEDEESIERDGIIVTLDAVWKDAPWELKATFSSSEKPMEENLTWIKQVMAQCYVKGTTTARLSRLEIMGNWRSVFGKKEEKSLPENRKPTLSAWKFNFTQEELQRNWEWLKDRRDRFASIIATEKLAPKVVAVPSGQTWECGYCVFRGNRCVEE